jgi:NAD+ synthase (glutamine-hydrolysing)
MIHHGFARVAACTPVLRVADPAFNAARIVEQLEQAEAEGVAAVVFPELSLTGYTCGDLFAHPTLLRAAEEGLRAVLEASRRIAGVFAVGLPLAVDGQLFNCAAVGCQGALLGVVPKCYPPNYREFYEGRWFAPAAQARSKDVRVAGQTAPFGVDLVFPGPQGLTLGVEVCEDLWVPVPPSSRQALRGATVLLNLSASNETVGKAAYRRQLVVGQSGRCLAAYVYSSCGVHESTTDLVFGGHCLIAENGVLLGESRRFQRGPEMLVRDVDLERLTFDRARTTSFGEGWLYGGGEEGRAVAFSLPERRPVGRLRRRVEGRPFVPSAEGELRERCEEIFNIQVAGLARRLEQVGKPTVAIGVSGGLDSTLALLVTCKTFDLLGEPRAKIQGLTMPGFGTTGRTLRNAHALMSQLGVTGREVDIRPLCLEEWKALGHQPFGISLDGLDVEGLTRRLREVPPEKRHDLVFENVQARMRTSLLMNTALVIGTGDVSELALGWCTYNADHMSMYNPNASIPKTLVKLLVGWVAENEHTGPARETLRDIVATVISPELLPLGHQGEVMQSTEESVGPYELHDFFLYHFLRFGAPPEKVLYLASQADFSRPYMVEEVRKWLGVFLRRFFSSQFKRSCLPDGPKVGSVSLSPRGDWRMPSDAAVTAWLTALDAPS